MHPVQIKRERGRLRLQTHLIQSFLRPLPYRLGLQVDRAECPTRIGGGRRGSVRVLANWQVRLPQRQSLQWTAHRRKRGFGSRFIPCGGPQRYP